jgi:hypothetical protein
MDQKNRRKIVTEGGIDDGSCATAKAKATRGSSWQRNSTGAEPVE